MSNDNQKKSAALDAISCVKGHDIIGVGTGSTVNYFIEALAPLKGQLEGVVSSSNDSTLRLKQLGIPVLDLNSLSQLPIYIDGADEVTRHGAMIKGGGGALTREKIIAAVAREFICIVDASKQVGVLGEFPLPIEVIPMARSYVAREIVKLGGNPIYREGVTTDNGNKILDVTGLDLVDPIGMETLINNITGVVTNGLFAKRPADRVIVGH